MNRPQGQSILHQALWQAGLDRIERLSNMPDAAMRRAVWEEDLRAIGDLAAVWTVDVLIWESVRGDTKAQRIYDGLFRPDTVVSIFPADRLASLRDLAIEESAFGAYHWFSCMDACESISKTEYQGPRSDRPLGVRRADARRAQGKELEKLLHDPDPDVIANLMHSPHITEAFVLKLCSKRPVPPEVLVVMTQQEKWFNRYCVKRALLLNPALPGEYAHNLMVYLSPKDLMEYSNEPTVRESLRVSASRLVRGLHKLQDN